MTNSHPVKLAWHQHKGHDCLQIDGWRKPVLRDVVDATLDDPFQGLAIVPATLVETSSNKASIQPMAGTFNSFSNSILFVPRFPFVNGVSYSLVTHSLGNPSTATFTTIATIHRGNPSPLPTTKVVGIYPTTKKLPLNQLKIYVHFSNPMSEGWANRAIKLIRSDNNEPLKDPFNIGPELWDQQRKRLTLLLDPARIKHGLASHEEAGYPLIEGNQVVLTVSAQFQDATGQPLLEPARRNYDVGAPISTRISYKDWRWTLPTGGSKEHLKVTFDRPLDHALLEHSFWINRDKDSLLEGKTNITQGEESWSFTPKQPWQPGRHYLIINTLLEDLAGNSIVRPFDRNILTDQQTSPADKYMAVEFSCH